MRNWNSPLRVLTVAILVILTASPAWAARGKADFTNYIALGDSYGAGVVNASLVESHQQKGYVAVLARQAGVTDFQLPTVSQPGIGPELQLVSINPLRILPKAATPGAPTNLDLQRPYNNLSIPGARAHDLLSLTGFDTPDTTPKLFAQFILRGIGTAVQQTVAVGPTFISVWIGGNDVLGAVLAGTPAALTPLADFEHDYDAIIRLLTDGAPNAGMVLGSVADVSAVPFANTIPPFIINPATGQPLIIGGSPVFYIADLGGGEFGQLPPGSLVTLAASEFLATGYGIPAELAPALPPLPDIGKPLPDAVVLTPQEVQVINERVGQVNQVIFETGARYDVPVVDFASYFESVKNGLHFGGITLDNSFLTGGIFSYDGFHPTDLGYTLIANEFIKTINANYGTKIPFATITDFYANNAKRSGARSRELRNRQIDGSSFEFSIEAWENLLKITGSAHRMRMPDPVF
jgi:lysophospholipase L1-like esterase